MNITFTQCKQINELHGVNWRDVVESINDQPDWIFEKLDIADIQAIQQGGCASGAYMPAVTYYQALHTMSLYGDDVLQYIEDNIGELPKVSTGTSWAGIAVLYLSCAVELWAGQFDLDGVNWD